MPPTCEPPGQLPTHCARAYSMTPTGSSAGMWPSPTSTWTRSMRPGAGSEYRGPGRSPSARHRNASASGPLRHVLLGMNAHINFDLPQALLAVISDDEFSDPALLARREADHRRIDDVLSARVSAEDDELRRLEPAQSW